MRVLLIEDEVRLATTCHSLRDGPGFAVDWAEDAWPGRLRKQPLLRPHRARLMLPSSTASAFSVVSAPQRPDPVLILTAKDGADSIIQLLNAGADDYSPSPST